MRVRRVGIAALAACLGAATLAGGGASATGVAHASTHRSGSGVRAATRSGVTTALPALVSVPPGDSRVWVEGGGTSLIGSQSGWASISATWVNPAIPEGGWVAIWPGIQGFTTSCTYTAACLVQAGTIGGETGSANGLDLVRFFAENADTGPNIFPALPSAAPGDLISTSLTRLGPGSWQISVADLTQHTSFTRIEPWTSMGGQMATFSVEAMPGKPALCTPVDWISASMTTRSGRIENGLPAIAGARTFERNEGPCSGAYTTTTVVCSPNPTSNGANVSCAVTTSVGSGPIPTGTIVIADPSNTAARPVGTCVLVNGSCAITTTSILAGSSTITAAYSGSSTDSPSYGSTAVTTTIPTPLPTCPAGDTGTYPNCAAPPRPPSLCANCGGGTPLPPEFPLGNTTVVAITSTPDGAGYWITTANGGVYSFGDASFFGSMGGTTLSTPIAGMAVTPNGHGYWLVGSDGGVFAFGDAAFYGSIGGHPLAAPVVGIASTPHGHGYWLVASDGGVFAFGSAKFDGSMGRTHLNAPMVGIAATPGGRGYWLVASDGGIFTFGSAQFYGSAGNLHLNAPVVGMASTPNGHGYWLVAKDGGVFAFGDAPFHGSTSKAAMDGAASGIAADPSTGGYWLVRAISGLVFPFDAPFFGSA